MTDRTFVETVERMVGTTMAIQYDQASAIGSYFAKHNPEMYRIAINLGDQLVWRVSLYVGDKPESHQCHGIDPVFEKALAGAIEKRRDYLVGEAKKIAAEAERLARLAEEA